MREEDVRIGDIDSLTLDAAIQAVIDLSVEVSFDAGRFTRKQLENLGQAARILAGTCERESNLI